MEQSSQQSCPPTRVPAATALTALCLAFAAPVARGALVISTNGQSIATVPLSASRNSTGLLVQKTLVASSFTTGPAGTSAPYSITKIAIGGGSLGVPGPLPTMSLYSDQHGLPGTSLYTFPSETYSSGRIIYSGAYTLTPSTKYWMYLDPITNSNAINDLIYVTSSASASTLDGWSVGANVLTSMQTSAASLSLVSIVPRSPWGPWFDGPPITPPNPGKGNPPIFPPFPPITPPNPGKGGTTFPPGGSQSLWASATSGTFQMSIEATPVSLPEPTASAIGMVGLVALLGRRRHTVIG